MALADNVRLRPASLQDVDSIHDLIVVSARELSRSYYHEAQIEAAIAHVFGVDTTLIADGTYFITEAAGAIIGCGGWSRRRTLFGGDQYTARDSGFSNPALDAAKIRAFFVHPKTARCGVGRALLRRCETEARNAGYTSAELISTQPGAAFYKANGYTPEAPRCFTVGNVEIEFVPMRKIF